MRAAQLAVDINQEGKWEHDGMENCNQECGACVCAAHSLAPAAITTQDEGSERDLECAVKLDTVQEAGGSNNCVFCKTGSNSEQLNGKAKEQPSGRPEGGEDAQNKDTQVHEEEGRSPEPSRNVEGPGSSILEVVDPNDAASFRWGDEEDSPTDSDDRRASRMEARGKNSTRSRFKKHADKKRSGIVLEGKNVRGNRRNAVVHRSQRLADGCSRPGSQRRSGSGRFQDANRGKTEPTDGQSRGQCCCRTDRFEPDNQCDPRQRNDRAQQTAHLNKTGADPELPHSGQESRFPSTICSGPHQMHACGSDQQRPTSRNSARGRGSSVGPGSKGLNRTGERERRSKACPDDYYFHDDRSVPRRRNGAVNMRHRSDKQQETRRVDSNRGSGRQGQLSGTSNSTPQHEGQNGNREGQSVPERLSRTPVAWNAGFLRQSLGGIVRSNSPQNKPN